MSDYDTVILECDDPASGAPMRHYLLRPYLHGDDDGGTWVTAESREDALRAYASVTWDVLDEMMEVLADLSAEEFAQIGGSQR